MFYRRNGTSQEDYWWSSSQRLTGLKMTQISEDTSTQHYSRTAMILHILRNQHLGEQTSWISSSNWYYRLTALSVNNYFSSQNTTQLSNYQLYYLLPDTSLLIARNLKKLTDPIITYDLTYSGLKSAGDTCQLESGILISHILGNSFKLVLIPLYHGNM